MDNYTITLDTAAAQTVIRGLLKLPLEEVLATYQTVLTQLQAQDRARMALATEAELAAHPAAASGNGKAHDAGNTYDPHPG